MLWLLGEGGIGKSVLMTILTIALAGCDVRDLSQLCQQLDKGYGRNMLEAKPLVAFHEVDGAPVNAVERLKSLVTESELHLAEKFKATQLVPVFARFVLLINEYNKVMLRNEPHEARRVLYVYTPVQHADVAHLMPRMFEIKNDRERARHAGLALLDHFAMESPDVLPGLPPDTEIKRRVMKAFSGERGIHGHLSTFLSDSARDGVEPTGAVFFTWLQNQGIRHRLTSGQLEGMVQGRLGMDAFFRGMNEAHHLGGMDGEGSVDLFEGLADEGSIDLFD